MKWMGGFIVLYLLGLVWYVADRQAEFETWNQHGDDVAISRDMESYDLPPNVRVVQDDDGCWHVADVGGHWPDRVSLTASDKAQLFGQLALRTRLAVAQDKAAASKLAMWKTSARAFLYGQVGKRYALANHFEDLAQLN